VTNDMLRVHFLDELTVLREIHVRTERDLVDSHLPLNLIPVGSNEIFRLFQQVL
jgi:hypothetical protein